ncbi:phosphate signaling complex protein PhoU [Thermohalobacter berrensis]|uniref:Phosphate-specific transport system accessory protein PhoU n=1 Tax=Thermohalobacter berrensis TaxID=99594 RepID=A0A419TA11_9FIRM|nr:phosphate signaling complex protein PhoU [Thermohalobacter berrensis]RKD34287.1 phosphate transport system regulatory protein PhoU [Thermohalobacter berrensis]
MRKHFHEELKNLHQSLLKMGAMVEDVIDTAITSLIEQDLAKADEVIIKDDKVDEMEIYIEKKCLELLALQQPLAKDLRQISGILKIITDLERIGDHGVNIARVTRKIGKEKFVKPLIDIPKMADIAKEMVKKSLDSFINEDVELAKEVAKMDDLVDDIYEDIYIELLEMLSENKKIMQQVVNLLFIGRYLERIADHTTNICERIVYMATGERVEY